MATKLTTPETVQSPYGPVQATHEDYGHIFHPHVGQVRSFRYLGTVDADGKFNPFPNAEGAGVLIENDDYKELIAPTTQGKPAGVFRTDDVIRIHKKVASRP